MRFFNSISKVKSLLFIAVMASSLGTYSQSACTAGNYAGAYVLNANDYPYFSPGSGVTVSATLGGGIGTLNNFQYSCNNVIYNCTNPAWWMNNAAQSITFTFSQPVSSFSVIVNGTNNCEEFYFAVVGGPQGCLQASSLCPSNNWVSINGGTGLLYNGAGATSNLIVVSNPAGATTYLLTHNGCGAGSRYALVDCFELPSAAQPTLTSVMAQVDASCGNCDGTATVTPAGGNAPYSYTWNTVPAQNTQTATNLCPGTYIVNFIDASGCLNGADTVTILSAGASLPPPVITPAGPFCTVDPQVNLSANPAFGTWSGTGITNPATGTFDPLTAGVGTHQIIYQDTAQCGDADTINIIVNSNANATINPSGPHCPGDPPVILTAIDPGGTWSGNGITNPATGEFTPGNAGIGTHTITYAIGGSCGDTQTVNITVSPLLNPTITPAGPFCLSDPPINLSAVDPGGSWSGPGITNVINGTFDPNIAGVGVHVITYGIPGGCGDTTTANITVTNSLNATITPVGPYCESDPIVLLTAVDAGGIWSGNGITNVNTGAFDPNVAGPGLHTITYGISASCGDTQSVDILIIQDADATITPAGPYCVADLPIVLTAVDPGGNWTGTGITNAVSGTFDPMIAGIGIHTITYTIAGQCGDVQTTNITVNAMDDATITPVGPFCVDAPAVLLSSATAVGTWSGNGIINAASGAFDPMTAGSGTHTITFVTAGVCSSTDTEDIIVNPLPVVDFVSDTASLCALPKQPFEFYNLTDTTGGMVGTTLWNFGDGSSANGDTVSHTYNDAGIYDITLTVTSTGFAGGCTDNLTKAAYVQVFENPTAHFLTDNNPTTMFDPTITFIDQSFNNVVAWDWNVGGLITSTQSSFVYTFPEDTGHYLITLFVTDANGCEDSTSGYAIVRGEYGIFVPNSFTPDLDGLNDGFSPKGYGIAEVGYSFMIFDRWGEKIFETNKTFFPWNGGYKGKLVPNGVYAWKLYYTDINGLTHEEIGHVTVLK